MQKLNINKSAKSQFTIERREQVKLMKKWDILLLREKKYQLILNLMAATRLRKVGTGQQKSVKLSNSKKQQLEERVASN